MGLGRVHTCASVLIGLLRSPSEHPPLAMAALADPWEPQWAPPPTIAALADPQEPQWAFPHQPQQLWQTLASAPQPRTPPPPTDTCRTPGSASHSTWEAPSPSWELVSARPGGSGQVAWLCPWAAPQSLEAVPGVKPRPYRECTFPYGSPWS